MTTTTPEAVAALKERLLNLSPRLNWRDEATCDEAADTITALSAERDAKDARIAELEIETENFAKDLELSNFDNVTSHLSARMCCNGHMCGCRGSTVGDYLAYELRAALKRETGRE